MFVRIEQIELMKHVKTSRNEGIHCTHVDMYFTLSNQCAQSMTSSQSGCSKAHVIRFNQMYNYNLP